MRGSCLGHFILPTLTRKHGKRLLDVLTFHIIKKNNNTQQQQRLTSVRMLVYDTAIPCKQVKGAGATATGAAASPCNVGLLHGKQQFIRYSRSL